MLADIVLPECYSKMVTSIIISVFKYLCIKILIVLNGIQEHVLQCHLLVSYSKIDKLMMNGE